MKLKIFFYFSGQRAAFGPPPVETGYFSVVDPDTRGTEGGELHQLAGQYRAWRDGVAEYDYVGFENAARPMFILPMPSRRLAMHHPVLLGLRQASLQARDAKELVVSPGIFFAYEAARAAFDDADGLRLRNWVSRLDIAAPPASAADTLRARHTELVWPAYVTWLRRLPAFRAAPDAVFNLASWPRGNAYILRTELFIEFATILFESLAEILHGQAPPNPRFAEFMAERLFGAFLAAKLFANPLLATSGIPLLRAVPAEPPAAPPAGFNAAGYAMINLDLEPGLAAREHYLSIGWREGREWDLQ